MTKYLNKSLIRSILLIVVFPIVSLRLLGFWQWMEWYSYDLLFYLSPTEPTDERIVLVVWDEKDLQRTSSATMSDLTLSLVLDKIKEQQPRFIGLDIYRDIPVPSRLLSKEQNNMAYKRLQDIFRSTPNLIGIEKVREPIINPNPILVEQKQTAASDLITDPDNVLRRSFINTSRDSSYIGMALGYLYLAHEGWNHEKVGESSLAFFKDDQKIVLQDVKNWDGGYINNKVGRDFLVNWRKGSDQFLQYSVSELLTGKVPTDAFYDKIVLLGNVSSSTADLHYLPTAKWDKVQPWTYGVNVVAQIASSIISAALDERPLLRVAPWGMGYLLLALGIFSMTLIILKFSTLRIKQLYLISSVFSLILTGLLLVASLVAFQAVGWWIPIVPAVLGVWLTFNSVNYEVQIQREKNNLSQLELLTGHLGHEIGNSTYAIQMNTEEIEVKTEDAQSLVDLIWDNFCHQFPESEPKSYDLSDDYLTRDKLHRYLDELKKNLTEIQEQTRQIWLKLQKISRQRKRTKYYIKLTNFWSKRAAEITMVNDFVRELVEEVTMDLQEEYEIKIEVKQIYDPHLSRIKLDRFSLEIILKNLLENAFDTLSAKSDTASNYNPTVIVETKKSKQGMEITVEDNGSGIPKAFRNKIFKLGVSGKSAAQGQGIGLFLVQELLNLQQGQIRLESRVGEGSKFIVSLPKKR